MKREVMGSSEILRTTRKIILSRFFLISVVLWILFTFVLTIVGVGFTSTATINNYEVSDNQVSTLSIYNGTALKFFAQDFNSYGSGIGGTQFYYNISGGRELTGSVQEHLASGYAGQTNSTGFIEFNISNIMPGYQYFINFNYYNPQNGINASVFYTVSTGFSPEPLSSAGVSITPVRSIESPGNFALHLFTAPGNNVENATVFYQRSQSINTYLTPPFFSNYNFNYNNTVEIAKINISGPVNIVTEIPAHGQPYFYGAGINYSNGSNAGRTLFSTLPTANQEFMQFSGIMFGFSSLFIIVACSISVILLISPKESRKNRLSRIIPLGFENDDTVSRKNMFVRRILVTLIATIPIVAVTAFFTYLGSVTSFGHYVNFAYLLAYSAGLITTVVFMAAYASIILGTGLVVPVPLNHPLIRRYNRRVTFLEIPSLLALVAFALNLSNSFFTNLNPSAIVLSNFVNPFAYIYLILERINGSLTNYGVYSFNALQYGITTTSVVGAGILWIIVWLIVPYLLFRHFNRSLASGS